MLCCACDVESVPDILNAISCVCWTWSHDDSDWMIRVMFPSLCACAVLMPSHRFGMLIFPSKFRYKKRGISRAMEALSRPKKLTSSLYGSIDFMSRARQRFVWMRFACDLFCLLIAFLSSRSGRWAKRLFFFVIRFRWLRGIRKSNNEIFSVHSSAAKGWLVDHCPVDLSKWNSSDSVERWLGKCFCVQSASVVGCWNSCRYREIPKRLSLTRASDQQDLTQQDPARQIVSYEPWL